MRIGLGRDTLVAQHHAGGKHGVGGVDRRGAGAHRAEGDLQLLRLAVIGGREVGPVDDLVAAIGEVRYSSNQDSDGAAAAEGAELAVKGARRDFASIAL